MKQIMTILSFASTTSRAVRFGRLLEIPSLNSNVIGSSRFDRSQILGRLLSARFSRSMRSSRIRLVTHLGPGSLGSNTRTSRSISFNAAIVERVTARKPSRKICLFKKKLQEIKNYDSDKILVGSSYSNSAFLAWQAAERYLELQFSSLLEHTFSFKKFRCEFKFRANLNLFLDAP